MQKGVYSKEAQLNIEELGVSFDAEPSIFPEWLDRYFDYLMSEDRKRAEKEANKPVQSSAVGAMVGTCVESYAKALCWMMGGLDLRTPEDNKPVAVSSPKLK